MLVDIKAEQKKQGHDLEYHIKRTNLLDKSLAFVQWVLPVCVTVLGVAITLAIYFSD